MLDTGNLYRDRGTNKLLSRVLREVPQTIVFVQVKFGGQRDPAGRFIGHNASPAAVKKASSH